MTHGVILLKQMITYLIENYGDSAGFRAWFALQHYDKFNDKYKPFITRMVVEVPFQGQVHTFESMRK